MLRSTNNRITLFFTVLVTVALLLSACIPPTAPSAEEEAASDAILEDVEDSVEATVAAAPPSSEEPEAATMPDSDEVHHESEPYDLSSSHGEEAFEEEVIGAAYLEGTEDADLSVLYQKTLSFDFNDDCENIYVDASLILQMGMDADAAVATDANSAFWAGVADAVETVTFHGGACGVALALQPEVVEGDVTMLAAENEQPLFVSTHDRAAALDLAGQIDDQIINEFDAGTVEALLALDPQVIYTPAGASSEQAVAFPINPVQITVAYQAADRENIETGFVDYVLGYSSIFATVELIQETLDAGGIEALGGQALFAAADQAGIAP